MKLPLPSGLIDEAEARESLAHADSVARCGGREMSDVKHTPGPWPGPWTVDDSGFMPNGDELPIVACAWPFAEDPSNDLAQLANARLIAAAPDLLAACKYLLALIDVLRTHPKIDELLQLVEFAELRAAIAKAESGAV